MELKARNRQTVARLSLLVIGMAGFAWALIPLYNLLCEITGLGGRTAGTYVYEPATEVVDSRAEQGGVEVHPGELHTVNFYVRNTTSKVMVGQAVPSLVPILATEHFHKTECFCFERQVLQPGETMAMPMRFIVGAQLPAHVKSVNLSYALFDVSEFAEADLVNTANANGKS